METTSRRSYSGASMSSMTAGPLSLHERGRVGDGRLASCLLRSISMLKTHVLIAVLASAAACGSPGATTEGMSDAGTSDAGAPVADAVPFTSGVSTLAGGAQTGNADGDRSVARFSNPVNVLIAPDGTLYVSDFDNGT